MDNVAISRRNHINKKGNKENTQPAHGSKATVKRAKTTVAPFQLKSNEKHETLTKNGRPKIKAKPVDARSTSSETLAKVKSKQNVGKDATDFRKVASEVPKLPAAMPSRSAPGMYKGKIVQSKIGSLWKSGATAGCAEPKLSAPKTESARSENMQKCRSKSVSDLPRCHTHKPASKSVLSGPTVTSRPPARAVSATLTSTGNITVAPTKGSGIQTSKPKITVTKEASKPVSSKLGQYRLQTVETTEQKRAKLAEWLASKGKTLKRPAMTTSAPPKTKVAAKPEVEHKSQSHIVPQPATEFKSKAKQNVEAHKPDSASAAQCADTQETQLAAYRQTPVVMDTTLELLENSVEDVLMDPRDGVDDIVVNLCDALEAMATPSRCTDVAQGSDEHNVEIKDDKSKQESKKELQIEMLEHYEEQKFEQVQNEAKESLKHKVETDNEEDYIENDTGVTTHCMENASIIKYSVKTTPYLQSVKKTIEVETSSSTSRRKSNIKDLKFLTPVRRSCRIQRNSCHLPSMLVDHDPCVASLAELVKLDDDPNAYIYRRNPALLEDVPDQPGS